jgi:hypothetical protein
MVEMRDCLQRRSKDAAKGWPDGEDRYPGKDSSTAYSGPETAQHRSQKHDETAKNESVSQAWQTGHNVEPPTCRHNPIHQDAPEGLLQHGIEKKNDNALSSLGESGNSRLGVAAYDNQGEYSESSVQ